MGKTLSERVATRATNKKPSRSAWNRGAFLALRSEVKQALDDGWPVKTIWETLQEEGKITFSYQSFRGYANRLILSRGKAPEPAEVVDQENAKAPKGGPTGQAMRARESEKPARIGGFRFESEPNKEDLL
jgi:hypothetical protein